MKVDNEIIVSCIKDDRKAIEQLYKYCFTTLMPICYRYHKNEEDARSSLNIGFLKIVKALKDVELDAFNFNAWSKRIMNNALIDEYRKTKKHKERFSITDSESELDYFADSDKNEALSNFGESTILDLIKELPIATGQVFNMYVIDGYAHKEIAEILDIPEGTSKWHLSQAKKMLREKLEKIESINKRMVI
jgi:RNA polymerase sigma factor (sigma-70 family)|tara:strand:- start:6884 stop:7456 length:573 start_codon:yes stop_codon:yes gene_type:complete